MVLCDVSYTWYTRDQKITSKKYKVSVCYFKLFFDESVNLYGSVALSGCSAAIIDDVSYIVF